MNNFKNCAISLNMLDTDGLCGVLGLTPTLILISKKFQSNYIYTLNSALRAPLAGAAIKQLFFGCLIDLGVAYQPYKTPLVNYFLAHILNPIHCLVLQMEIFYQHRHVSSDNAK